MVFKRFDKTELILRNVDTIVLTNAYDSDKSISIEDIIKVLEDKIIKNDQNMKSCKETDIRYKYLFTHTKCCEKRIQDLKYMNTLRDNYDEYSKYKLLKLFNLIKLKDKLQFNKFSVSIDEE